jgi:hypothetical protein
VARAGALPRNRGREPQGRRRAGEALVTTALGLLIAIVALVLYAVARALEQGYRLEVLGSCARFEQAVLATHA